MEKTCNATSIVHPVYYTSFRPVFQPDTYGIAYRPSSSATFFNGTYALLVALSQASDNVYQNITWVTHPKETQTILVERLGMLFLQPIQRLHAKY